MGWIAQGLKAEASKKLGNVQKRSSLENGMQEFIIYNTEKSPKARPPDRHRENAYNLNAKQGHKKFKDKLPKFVILTEVGSIKPQVC